MHNNAEFISLLTLYEKSLTKSIFLNLLIKIDNLKLLDSSDLCLGPEYLIHFLSFH